MEKENMLVSITADTSMVEKKLGLLLEVLPEHVSDEFLSVISGLLNDVVFVNYPITVGAGGTLNFVCTLDFDAAAYDQVMAAARTFKANVTHK